MRKNLEKFRAQILILSILMSFCLPYLPYDGLSEIHFLSPHVIFENFGNVDQEDLGLGPPNQSKGIISASSAALNYLRFHSIRDSFLSPFQSFSLDRRISILRC